MGEANFEWVVETAANYAIEKALSNNENGLPIEQFIQALTSQLDRAQATMALKARAGLPSQDDPGILRNGPGNACYARDIL